MIKAIVFDIGGVLLRTEDWTERQQLEKKYHLPPGGADQLVFNSPAAQASTIGKAPYKSVWDHVANQLGLSPEALQAFKRLFWSADQVDQELIDFLQKSRSTYITALLSNAWQDARSIFAERYGIKEGETADHVLISSELGVAKPDARIYQILAEKIKCDFHEILFIDDLIDNIEAAKELGIHTIHYKPGMDLINKIELKLNEK